MPPAPKTLKAASRRSPKQKPVFQRRMSDEERRALAKVNQNQAQTEARLAEFVERFGSEFDPGLRHQIDWSKSEKRTMQKFLDQSPGAPKILALTGTVGTGKTHTAISLGYDAILLGQGFLLLPWGEFIAAQRSDSPVTAREKSRWARIGLLVIDDFLQGKASLTDFQQQAFHGLMDTRLQHGRPTIITSNLSLVEWNDTVSPASYDRLRAGIGSAEICFSGNSLR